MTPIDFWLGAWRNAAVPVQTGTKLGEMARASEAVVSSRMGTMQNAMIDPAAGDYAEMTLMVTEKVEAVWDGALAAAADIVAWQSEALAQWQALTIAMMSGRPVTPSQLNDMTARSVRMVTRAGSAASKALAPVHRKARANARRLGPRVKA